MSANPGEQPSSNGALPVVREPAVPAVMDRRERWSFVGELAVFQIKLIIDGFKDVVLGPLSLLAGIFDLARGTPRDAGLFRRVLRLGAEFDRWVGLFDGADGADGDGTPDDPALDEQLRRLEHLLVAQRERGGLSADAQKAVDLAIGTLEARLGAPPE